MFSFDFPLQLQSFLNQHWLAIHFGLIFLWLFLIYLTAKKPILGAGLIIVLLPTYLFRTKIFGLPTTYLEMCLGIFFVTFFIKTIIAHKQGTPPPSPPNYQLPITSYKLIFPLILLLLAATISIFVSPSTLPALGLWKAYFIEPILFFLILLKIIKTPKDKSRTFGGHDILGAKRRPPKVRDKEIIFWSLGISTLSISLYAIFQKFTGFGIAEPAWLPAATRRVTAFFTSPNAVGLYLGPIFVLYLTSLLSHLKKNLFILANHHNYQTHIKYQLLHVTCYMLHIIFLLPMLLAIIFTKSQGTWLGVLAGLIFFIFFYKTSVPSAGPPNRRASRIIRHLAIILIILMFIAILTLPPLRQTILPILTFSDAAGQNRLSLWQGSWRFLTASPKNFIFGAGLFGFPEIHEQSRDPLKTEPLIYPHNIILNFWLDIGLLGLIAFIWILVIACRVIFKHNKLPITSYQLPVTVSPALAALITILVHGLVDVPYFKNDLAILFWVIISLAFVQKIPTNNINNKTI